jgi:penicillin-binding protein 1C
MTKGKANISNWCKRKWAKRKFRVFSILTLVLLVAYLFCLPDPLFDDPTSTVLEDRNQQLLGARIATDGQWRFPELDTVPEKFAKALIAFEDKRFPYHPGVDPLAIARAMRLNLSQGEVVSGGSTLSMQVIRLARKGKDRTIWEKLVEMVQATRMELRYSKGEILALYASHAPFGGNVVGLDAAAWKYFGRSAHQLSWAEAATLAVLPNAPALIHPGRNRDALKQKRNFLLEKLAEAGEMDSLSCELAKLEPLPAKPKALPQHAPHLMEKVHQEHLRYRPEKTRLVSTLDLSLQNRANQAVRQHYYRLRQNQIHNAAALILEVKSGDVLAYVGNTPCQEADQGCAVDIIHAPRSTGSILKPFLYANMINEGELLPHTLVPDVPSYYAGYNPSNYNRVYHGAVPASRALARSLNIPSVRMLQEHGVGRFQDKLKQLGLSTLHRPASDYGLTLVLGGAEATLWDLTQAYAGMARTLNNHVYYGGRYEPDAYRSPNFHQSQSRYRLAEGQFDRLQEDGPLSAAAIWHTFEAMVEVSRPETEQFWRQFASSRKIAWKTGTSYGFRDAWAIGLTPVYVIAVWVGNADGEGRPGLIGTQAAAPLMFDLFNSLGKATSWFAEPVDEMEEVEICAQSGHRVSEHCPETRLAWIYEAGRRTRVCPYHQPVFLDPTATYRVNSDCELPLNMKKEVFFVLPPTQEVYYRQGHPDYLPLPDYREDCREKVAQNANVALIYPQAETRIYVPVELDGSLGSTVFEAAHRNAQSILYWHLDDRYMGKTTEIHEMEFQPSPGWHTLTLVDEAGEKVVRRFEILAEDQEP